MPHKMNSSNHLPEGNKKTLCRRYYAENRERILARQKQWRTENAAVIKAPLEAKREQINRNRRKYRKKNKERVSGYQRKYRENRKRIKRM